MAEKADLIGVGVEATQAGLLGANVETVAAAGSAITDATAATQKLIVATGADGTKGIKLPAGKTGDVFIVKNVANAVLKLYPASASVAMNGGTAGAAVSMAAYEMAIVFQNSATNCYGAVAVVF